MRRATYRGLLVLAAVLGGCLQPLTFECLDDAACVFEERQGQCIAPGHCAYADATCDSFLRFGPAAGSGLASTCVDPTTTTGVSDATNTSAACGPCEPVTTECRASEATCADGQCVEVLLPAGAPCREADPCVVAAACDATGTCVIEEALACTDPPGPCHVSQGTCGEDGGCAYALRDAGAPCEDGDGCTLEDACDGQGACTPGAICPTDNPCAAGSCSGAQCSFFPVVDGTGCGPLRADLCCAGACIDATTDAQHCGGCEIACPAEQLCVPSGTSGMCQPTSTVVRMDLR